MPNLKNNKRMLRSSIKLETWVTMRDNSRAIFSSKLKTKSSGTLKMLLTLEPKTRKFLDKFWSQNTKLLLSQIIKKPNLRLRLTMLQYPLPLLIKFQLVERLNNSKSKREELKFKLTWTHSPKPSNNTTEMMLLTSSNWTQTGLLMASTQITKLLITTQSSMISLLTRTTQGKTSILTHSLKIWVNGKLKLMKLPTESSKKNQTTDSENLTTKFTPISVWKSITLRDLRSNTTVNIHQATASECSK